MRDRRRTAGGAVSSRGNPAGRPAGAVAKAGQPGTIPGSMSTKIAPATAEERFVEPLGLTVDMAGLAQAWVALEDAVTYHAKQLVAWSVGDVVREFRGGWQRSGV